MRKHAVLSLLVLLCAALPGQYTPDDDAGDVAFVHQVVQTLLGRKPRGAAEVQVLHGIAQSAGQGREAVVDVLLREPEFVDYWTTVMADAMQVQRDGDFAQKKSCFDSADYLTNATGSAEATLLADHIRDNTPSTPTFDPDSDLVANPFNMRDAIKASLLVDDLHVAWRPWLFVVAGEHGSNPSNADIRDNYMSTVFNLKTECVSCHSTSYSKTEIYVDGLNQVNHGTNAWDRTATTGFKMERSAFGTGNDIDPLSGTWGPLYDSICGGCHGADGTDRPQYGGISPKILAERVPLLSRKAIAAQILNGGGMMPSITDLGYSDLDGDLNTSLEEDAEAMAQFLRDQLGGWEDLDKYLDDEQFDPAHALGARPFGMSNCGFEWAPIVPDGSSTNTWAFAGASWGYPDLGRVSQALKSGLPAMLVEYGAAPTTWPTDGYLPAPNDPYSAVAMLVALNIVDDVYEEVFGARLALQHGLVRNPDAGFFKKELLEELVVDDGVRVRLSIKNLLKQMVLSELYNRRAPDVMAPSPDNGYEAYQLPMIANPWAATPPAGGAVGIQGDPSTSGDNLNGQGDFVHRRSPNQILWSLHHDLGWPAHKVYPSTDPLSLTYPTHAFMGQLGRFESAREPGAMVWRLDSLVLWEQKVGLCQNPDPAGTDWVDRSVAAAFAVPGSARLNVLVLGLKDRLLQEAVMTVGPNGESEEQLVIGLLNQVLPAPDVTSLQNRVNLWSQADIESALRAYCGVILVSPDYLIAGIPTIGDTLPPLPPAVLCLDNQEDCTVADLQTHYDLLLCDAGYTSPACP